MYQYSEENNIILITFSSLKLILCVQILVLGMLNLNTKGRHYLTKFLTAKPFIDTSYYMGHRLELKYYHFAQFFAQCSSSS